MLRTLLSEDVEQLLERPDDDVPAAGRQIGQQPVERARLAQPLVLLHSLADIVGDEHERAAAVGRI